MKNKSALLVLATVNKELDDVSWLEVECSKAASKSGSVMCGEWTFSLATPVNGTDVHRSRVVVWRTLEAKKITTITGLTALALTLDIRLPVFPLRDGDVGVWTRDPSKPARNCSMGGSQ
ncbi:hypothetical protein [Yoonia sp. MH D7]